MHGTSARPTLVPSRIHRRATPHGPSFNSPISRSSPSRHRHLPRASAQADISPFLPQRFFLFFLLGSLLARPRVHLCIYLVLVAAPLEACPIQLGENKAGQKRGQRAPCDRYAYAAHRLPVSSHCLFAGLPCPRLTALPRRALAAAHANTNCSSSFSRDDRISPRAMGDVSRNSEPELEPPSQVLRAPDESCPCANGGLARRAGPAVAARVGGSGPAGGGRWH